MRKSHIATLITTALVSLGAHGADLLQVYQQALANDAQYASARSALAAAQERIPQAKSALLPNITLSGSNTRTEGEKVQGVSTSGNSSSYTLSLTQALYNPALKEQVEQSKLSVSVSENQFALAKQDLILRTAQAYFDVLGAEEALRFTKAQKEATTEQLASAKRNFEVGTQTITDTHEAQAAYDLVAAQEYAAINDLEVRRTALLQIIGQVPASLANLKPGVTLNAPQPAKIDAWVETAEKQSNNVLIAQLNVESAKREITKDRHGHRPTASVTAGTNYSASNPLFNLGSSPNRITNTVTLNWSVPIFSGYAITSRVREAILQEEKARFDLENAKRTAAQSTRQAFLTVNSGLAQVKALEAAEVSSKSSLESNKLGYTVGVRINIDVLNAQRQLFSTQRDLARARFDTIVNGLRLKAAAGGLREDDLAVVNGLLVSK